MIKLFLLLLILKYSFLIAYAQVTQNWVTSYNGPPGNGTDIAYSIAVDGSGNVYVTGGSDGSGNFQDYATIKYNSSGVQQWVARYNGPGNNSDVANSIAVDGSGNVYVTGESLGSGTSYDYATIKYNSAGVQQWVQRYNGPGNLSDIAYSLAIDASGNVYVTGTATVSAIDWNYATIKYNTSGVQQWVQIYNGTGISRGIAHSIAVDGSGNVYVKGESLGSGTSYDYATIKYNTSGVQQWVQRYNGPPGNGVDIAYSIAVDGSGNVYVTGGSSGGSVIYDDYATIKYNSTGVQQWVQRYNDPGNGYDVAHSIAVDGAGNVYVTGGSQVFGTMYDYATIKYNSAGVQQWVQRYPGPQYQYEMSNYSMVLDGSGNVYVTGGSSYDYATIKYNTSGVQQWVQRYNGLGNGADIAYSIAIDGSGNVFVTGNSYGGSGTSYDYATIKYSQPVEIKKISNSVPERFTLYQNYPNPFNPTTTIKFDVPFTSNVIITVYDVLGREVTKLIDEKLTSGSYETKFDASNLPSGMYFYKLETNGFSETKKMMLVK